MITAALYQKMLQDGVANLHEGQRKQSQDDAYNFFWEESPLQIDGKPASGVWLISRGGDISATHRSLNLRTTVDFYIATKNKVITEQIHQQIRQYLTENLCFCLLSGIAGGVNYRFSNVRIRPTTTPENAGASENGLIVKIASVQLVYDDETNY